MEYEFSRYDDDNGRRRGRRTMRHTKGPWREWDAEIEGADGSKIGQLYARPEDDGTWGPGVADANTRLVCAAPDLLAALEALLTRAEVGLYQEANHEGLLNCDVLAQARCAIAKAKGGKE